MFNFQWIWMHWVRIQYCTEYVQKYCIWYGKCCLCMVGLLWPQFELCFSTNLRPKIHHILNQSFWPVNPLYYVHNIIQSSYILCSRVRSSRKTFHFRTVHCFYNIIRMWPHWLEANLSCQPEMARLIGGKWLFRVPCFSMFHGTVNNGSTSDLASDTIAAALHRLIVG